jgi:hypothetical protein
MNLIHRILGQALDTVQNQPVEQQLNIIFDVFSSPVAIALKHVNVRKILQQAILTQNYSYAVPYELFASEMKSDKYYRYEYTSSSLMCGTMVFYGKGEYLIERYEVIDAKDVLDGRLDLKIYEYDTYDLMLEEMREESYLSDTIYICDSVSTHYPVIWDNHKGMVSRVYNDDTGEYDMIAVEDMIY